MVITVLQEPVGQFLQECFGSGRVSRLQHPVHQSDQLLIGSVTRNQQGDQMFGQLSLTAGVACYNADGSVDSLVPPEREADARLKLARVRTDKLKKPAVKAVATDENKEH